MASPKSASKPPKPSRRALSKEWAQLALEHEEELLKLLAEAGVRAPDWSIAADWLDPQTRLEEGMEVPIKWPGESVVSGVYLFYDWTPLWDPKELNAGRIVKIPRHIVPLYVGKAVNLWNRMQTHWARPDERAWIPTYFGEVEADLLAGELQACAWRDPERAGLEARLLKSLHPRYCRRTE